MIGAEYFFTIKAAQIKPQQAYGVFEQRRGWQNRPVNRLTYLLTVSKPINFKGGT